MDWLRALSRNVIELCLFHFLTPSELDHNKIYSIEPPACPLLVARPILGPLHRACLILVGCFVELIVWRPPKTTIYFIFLIFCGLICRPKRCEIVPPICSSAISSHHNTYPHHKHCLLFDCCVSLHCLVAVNGHVVYFFILYFFSWNAVENEWSSTSPNVPPRSIVPNTLTIEGTVFGWLLHWFG
jgi:hypothetical protein